MKSKWRPGMKCSICHEEFEVDNVVDYFIDESGYMRVAHKECYDINYGSE